MMENLLADDLDLVSVLSMDYLRALYSVVTAVVSMAVEKVGMTE